MSERERVGECGAQSMRTLGGVVARLFVLLLLLRAKAVLEPRQLHNNSEGGKHHGGELAARHTGLALVKNARRRRSHLLPHTTRSCEMIEAERSIRSGKSSEKKLHREVVSDVEVSARHRTGSVNACVRARARVRVCVRAETHRARAGP